MDNHKLIESLKCQVLEQSRILPLEANGCRKLSEKIFESTKNYISEKTLLHFFSFNAQANSPKTFVLNSLCQFIGYESWNEYVNDQNIKP